MMNRVILIGRLTKDLELKTTQSNIPVVSFSIAVDQPYKNEEGERKADFFDCVAWRRQAELLVQYCGKGDQIAIDGRLSKRSYETESGMKYVTEVVCDNIEFLQPKKREEEEEVEEEIVEEKPKELNKKLTDDSDDLPF